MTQLHIGSSVSRPRPMATTNVGEIMYFPLRARAEPLRLLCNYAQLSYTDRIVQFEEWLTVKPTTPKGAMPVLTQPSGEAMPETADIARHLAAMAPKDLGLMPEDEAGQKEAARLFDISNTRPCAMVMPLTNWFSAEVS